MAWKKAAVATRLTVGVRWVAVECGWLVMRDAQRDRPDRVLARAARAVVLKLLHGPAQRCAARRVGALQREDHVGVDLVRVRVRITAKVGVRSGSGSGLGLG